MSRYVILLIIRVYRGSSLWPHFVSTQTLATLPTFVKSPLLPPMEPHTSVSIGEKQILDTYSKKKSGQQEHVYIYMYIICSALRWFEAYAAKPITAHSKISLYKISSL